MAESGQGDDGRRRVSIGEDEQVMSEIHLGCPPSSSGPCISRFTFSCLPLREGIFCDGLTLDEDGDLVLNRRRKGGEPMFQDDDDDNNDDEGSAEFCMKIQHSVTSSIGSVGMQVWRASLLLTDFILHKGFTSSDFNGITALEVGAGTGLVGIALARIAQKVFLTDKGTEVLDNCTANVVLNSAVFKSTQSEISVRELDWGDSWPPPSPNLSSKRSRYSWSSKDITEAEQATVLLAADVIYSDNLTDSLFRTLQGLMSRGARKILYLALEKRYNFSLDELDVVANGYAHFQSFFKNYARGCSFPCFIGEQIDVADIPQYVRGYERGKDLELWRIIIRLIRE